MPRSAERLALIAGFKEAIGLVDENGNEFVEQGDATENAGAKVSGPSREKIRRIAQEMADSEAERWDATVAAGAAKSTPRRRLPS